MQNLNWHLHCVPRGLKFKIYKIKWSLQQPIKTGSNCRILVGLVIIWQRNLVILPWNLLGQTLLWTCTMQVYDTSKSQDHKREQDLSWPSGLPLFLGKSAFKSSQRQNSPTWNRISFSAQQGGLLFKAYTGQGHLCGKVIYFKSLSSDLGLGERKLTQFAELSLW